MATAMANLRSVDGLLVTAVGETIDALQLDDSDAAAVRLARQYAAAIDARWCSHCQADTSLDALGPKLLACLESLGATPAARSKLRKGVTASDSPSRLTALRAARAG